MGRGDNRRSLKMRQRKAWRSKKERLNKAIEEAKAGKKSGGARRPAGTTTVRKSTAD